ncbi:response regulator [Paenibacillus puldeungensis]|uniref:Response regulator n=1 Tax=Paenibacillus puldeungensis TaxID=696536 RepID=A0ABW3RTQ4_9BACL
MIKMLIVDDEAMIRKGITTSIDWSEHHIQIVGEAINGKDALEKIAQLQPQIVLTDIRMPIIDGLELAETIKQNHPDVMVVILTGYEDFNYARQALKAGVTDYLLKPVGAEELIQVVIRLRKKIEQNLSIQQKEKENLLVLQTNFIHSMVHGEAFIVGESVIDKAKRLDIPVDGPEYRMLMIAIDDYAWVTEHYTEWEKNAIKYAVANVADEILHDWYSTIAVTGNFNHILSLINMRQGHSEDRLIQQCQTVIDSIRKYLKLSVTIGIGKPCSHLREIPDGYRQALSALRQKVYLGKGRVITYESIKKCGEPLPVAIPAGEEKDLIQALQSMDENSVNEIVDRIFLGVSKTMLSKSDLQNFCFKLSLLGAMQLEENGIVTEQPGEPKPIEELGKLDTLDDFVRWIKKAYCAYIDKLKASKSDKYRAIVRAAIQYIQAHYTEDVRLEEAANHIYITANYLGRVFKEETGETFTEWLNRYRVDKARPLLRNPSAKTYEVAESVGFNNYKYFTQIFKKYTGVTPKEYKNHPVG